MTSFFPEPLEELTQAIFVSAGAPAEEARTLAAHLVESNLVGHDSHGVMRIPSYVDHIRQGTVRLGVEPRVERDTQALAVIDGCHGFGPVVVRFATELALRKAANAAIGAVTVRNCNHSGRLGSYTTLAASRGFVAMMFVNAGGGGQSVAPFGGTSRRLATNPLSIAAPSAGPHPILLDIATSVIPEGKLRNAHLDGRRVPEGCLIDSNGQPATDPGTFYESGGALLPFGCAAGHKGFGLGFLVDILAGALTGAGVCREDAPMPSDGVLFIALDVKQFAQLERFESQVAELASYVKSSPPAAGVTEVFVPGELEYCEAERRRLEGIPVSQPVWNSIATVAAEFGLQLDVHAMVRDN